MLPTHIRTPICRSVSLSLALTLALAASASAYVNDVASSGASAIGSSSTQPLFQPCAQNGIRGQFGSSNVLSVGASVSLINDLGLQSMNANPQNGGAGSVVVGSETDPVDSDWRVSSTTFCADLDAPAPDGNEEGYVKSVRIVHAQSAVNSERKKGVGARCPEGMSVIGGGGDIDADGVTDLGFSLSTPFFGFGQPDGWNVAGHEVDPTDADWQVEAKVICADLSTAGGANTKFADDVEYVQSLSVFNSEGSKRQSARCPDGKKVIGGGADVEFPSKGPGFPGPADVTLKRSQPGGDDPTSTAWKAHAVETDGTSADWQLRSTAVCATLHVLPQSK